MTTTNENAIFLQYFNFIPSTSDSIQLLKFKRSMADSKNLRLYR